MSVPTRISVRIAVAGLSALASIAAHAQPSVADYSAARALAAFFDAFDNADRDRLAGYAAQLTPAQTTDQLLSFVQRVGPIDLVRITRIDGLHVFFQFRIRARATAGVGHIDFKDTSASAINNFTLMTLPVGVTDGDFNVDVRTRRRLLGQIERLLTDFYIEPTMIKPTIAAIRANEQKHLYDGLLGDALAHKLTADLRQASGDLHVRVDFVPAAMPPGAGPPMGRESTENMLRNNCGLIRAERLQGNLGVIRIDRFLDTSACGATVDAAMAFLAHVDALIFDLRQNGGGDPQMVAYVLSYLFAEPTHLTDFWNRATGEQRASWTVALPGKARPEVPVYVLIAKGTFSGGEEFAYDLKNLHRATLVGETTAGAAHPVGQHVIDERFSITVPEGRGINAVSNTDWEGVGVVPDRQAPADDALEVAAKVARSDNRGDR